MADIDLIGYKSGKIRKPQAGVGTLDSIGIIDNVQLQIGTGNDLKLYHDGTDSIIDNANGTLKIGTETDGAAITIGHGTSEVTIGDNLTVAGNLVVSGETTTLSTTNTIIEDKFIELGNGVTGSASGDAGLVIERGDDTNVAIIWDESADEFFLGTGAVTGASSGNLSLTASNLQAAVIRSSKLEIDGSSEHIDVSSNTMTLTATAGITLDAATDIVLDADGADIILKDGGTESARFTMDGTTSIELASQGNIIFDVGGTDLASMKSTGLHIIDDKKLVFGSNDDASFEYDEDGTDTLLYAGASIRISDDTKLEFGTGGDASFEYDEDGNDVLLYAGASLRISDDVKIEFGTGGDASIEYDEDGTDQLRISQPAAGVVIAGTNPKLVIGDAGEEDTFLVFDGNAQDYRIGLADGTDKLEFGLGATHGATTAFTIDSSHVTDFTANKLSYGGTVISATAAELNLLDGDTSVGSSITLADNDGIIVNDGGTMKSIPASDLATYVGSGAGATTNNALNASVNTKSSGDDANVVAGQVVCIDGSGKITGASALQSLSKLEVIGVATAAINANSSIGSNIHTAWGKVVNVKIESATIVAAGNTLFLESVTDAGLKSETPAANVAVNPPSAAGTDVYRLGYAVEAAGNGVTDVDIIWMPQFIVAN